MSDTMRKSWLIQRLKTPAPGWPGQVSEAFAFGGGMKNGGLTDNAMSLLRGIFRFDYMGAAEFEFGAVPEALQRLAEKPKKLTAFRFTIALADVAPSWRDKSGKVPDGSADVFVICQRDHGAEVEKRVRQWASEPFNELKETTQLSSTLRPYTEWDGEVVGWLELNNGFFFFTDEDMWTQTCRLFGVRPRVAAQ